MGAWVTSAALQALAVFQACVLLAQAPPWTSGRAFALWWWVIVKDGDGCPFHQFNVEILVQLGRVEMCTLRTWPARGWKVCGGIFFLFRASLSSPPSSCPSRSSSFFVSWLSGLYAPLGHECVPALVGEPLRPKRTSRLPPVPFAGPGRATSLSECIFRVFLTCGWDGFGCIWVKLWVCTTTTTRVCSSPRKPFDQILFPNTFYSRCMKECCKVSATNSSTHLKSSIHPRWCMISSIDYVYIYIYIFQQ